MKIHLNSIHRITSDMLNNLIKKLILNHLHHIFLIIDLIFIERKYPINSARTLYMYTTVTNYNEHCL